MDGEFLDAETVSLDPGDQTGLSFTIESEEAVTLELRLDIEDDLSVENFAFAGLTPMRTVSVLVVTDGNTPLRLGLGTPKAKIICDPEFVSPSYLDSEQYAARAGNGSDDLIIYDRCSPAKMPATNTFFIGSLPPAGEGEADSTPEDGDSTDPDATDDVASTVKTGWSSIWRRAG